MKNGELYEGDTLNQIWPAQKASEVLVVEHGVTLIDTDSR